MNGCPVERAGRVNFFVKYTVHITLCSNYSIYVFGPETCNSQIQTSIFVCLCIQGVYDIIIIVMVHKAIYMYGYLHCVPIRRSIGGLYQSRAMCRLVAVSHVYWTELGVGTLHYWKNILNLSAPLSPPNFIQIFV